MVVGYMMSKQEEPENEPLLFYFFEREKIFYQLSAFNSYSQIPSISFTYPKQLILQLVFR